MEKRTSIGWLGKVVALQGLLVIASKISLSMHIAYVIPWELMFEQSKFYDMFVSMQPALRDQPKETDPRWRATPLDPIPVSVFSFF